MLSPITEDLLVSLFLSIAEREKQADAIRQVLIEQPNFDINVIFEFLDRKRNSYITFSDIILFLRDEGLRFEEKEAYILLKEWDVKNEGKLDFEDLKRWILPSRYEMKNYDVGSARISYEVEYTLTKVFENELFHIRVNEETRIRLAEKQDFTLIDAFRSIDDDYCGYITPQSLVRFLQRNGIKQCDELVHGILHRLDKDNDGNLNYAEFLDALIPNDPAYQPKFLARKIDEPPIVYYTPNRPKRSNKSPQRKRPKSARPKSSQKSSRYESPTKSKNIITRNKLQVSKSKLNISNLRKTQKKELVMLANIFQDHIIFDKDLEKIRDQLALRLDFTIPELFFLFSPDSSGHISELDFENGLRLFSILPQGNQSYLLFRRYDGNGDGKLDLDDFYYIFLPRSCNYSHLLKERIADPKFKGRLSIETQNLVRECFRTLFIVEESLEGMRQKLNSRPNFDSSNLYEALVSGQSDYITIHEFRDVLRRNNYFPTEKDLDALFSFFDTNRDGKVTYIEFIQALSPKFS
ncbi:unnamed protein product [Blepharisma stoltei]|uniref:EF-hand domain-containing protein n=1 Tax=Blepharisma stoltei TaxID=1481888 RepID=A0AAU9ISN4_9CILI|nr:unnamed protein product [Blepharisma stoltei]